MLTIEEVETAVPPKLKSMVSQTLVDRINTAVADPDLAEEFRKNFISYTSVMRDGLYKMDDYINAVMYVSYKLMGMTNQDAWIKTFPQRYARLQAQGVSPKDIGSHVYAYKSNKLVNAIMEQTLVPVWVLNQHLFQEALNVQADLMNNAQSDMVRTTAANSLLVHLTKPKEAVGTLINIDMRETSGMDEMKQKMREMAQMQLELQKSGMTVAEIAGQRLVQAEVIDVN